MKTTDPLNNPPVEPVLLQRPRRASSKPPTSQKISRTQTATPQSASQAYRKKRRKKKQRPKQTAPPTTQPVTPPHNKAAGQPHGNISGQQNNPKAHPGQRTWWKNSEERMKGFGVIALLTCPGAGIYGMALEVGNAVADASIKGDPVAAVLFALSGPLMVIGGFAGIISAFLFAMIALSYLVCVACDIAHVFMKCIGWIKS